MFYYIFEGQWLGLEMWHLNEILYDADRYTWNYLTSQVKSKSYSGPLTYVLMLYLSILLTAIKIRECKIWYKKQQEQQCSAVFWLNEESPLTHVVLAATAEGDYSNME